MNSLRTDDRDDVLSLASLTYAQVRQRKAIAKTFPRLLREPAPSNCNRSPAPSPVVHDKHHARAWAVFRKLATSPASVQEAEEAKQSEKLAIPVQELPSALCELAAAGPARMDRSQVLLWLSRQGVAGEGKPVEWATFSKVSRWKTLGVLLLLTKQSPQLARRFLRQVEQHGLQGVFADNEWWHSPPPLRQSQEPRIARQFRPLYV
jgi:hypothetical protein